MQAVKGYLSNGWFTPTDEVKLPNHARVRIIIEEVIERPPLESIVSYNTITDAERQARIDGLNKIEAALDLIDDEDLSDFPKQGLMKLPKDYPWFD